MRCEEGESDLPADIPRKHDYDGNAEPPNLTAKCSVAPCACHNDINTSCLDSISGDNNIQKLNFQLPQHTTLISQHPPPKPASQSATRWTICTLMPNTGRSTPNVSLYKFSSLCAAAPTRHFIFISN